MLLLICVLLKFRYWRLMVALFGVQYLLSKIGITANVDSWILDNRTMVVVGVAALAILRFVYYLVKRLRNTSLKGFLRGAGEVIEQIAG